MMLNVEKYKNEIAELLSTKCAGESNCKECPFDNFCSRIGGSSNQIEKWLFEECKEPIKLTKVQYEILKCLPQCSSMQILNNEMIIHKDNLEFFLSKLGVKIIECDCEEKSIKIKEVLENCEVVENVD